MELRTESGALGKLGTDSRIFNMQESGKALCWGVCLLVGVFFFLVISFLFVCFSVFAFVFFFQLYYIQSELRKAAEINSNEIKHDKNISWQQE